MGDVEAVRSLLSARAVRERAHEMLGLAEDGALNHWSVDLDRLAVVEDYVLAVTRATYPDLDVPFHSRWRHLERADETRIASYRRRETGGLASRELGRAAFDLAILSVLIDAGAGQAWRYRSRGGEPLGRSEGLAIASLDMFEAGLFSSSRSEPRRVDASGLNRLTLDDLTAGLQSNETNQLEGLPGRLELLRGLSRAMASHQDLFAADGNLRPGGLFDYFVDGARNEPIPAARILETLLDLFGELWPSRLRVANVALGDAWRHPLIRRDDASDGVVPFHKLSQWMAYSLIEPLQWGGVTVIEIDTLTGLPEYRNGGLFVDHGVLRLRDPAQTTRAHRPGDLLIVEWRALTVALLDRLAARIRRRLNRDADSLPLARILQGGTWAAGRRIARELRPDGSPPLAVVSDGTVF